MSKGDRRMALDFITCVKQQIKWHPSMEPQDMYKLCYQVAFGAEHLLQDKERAWNYLQMEYEQTSSSSTWPLIEWLSEDVARVNLGTYKSLGLPLKTLFEVFVEGAGQCRGSKEDLENCFEVVEKMAQNKELPFEQKAWSDFCKGRQISPVHHSLGYKLKEQPAYRVVDGQGARQIEALLDLR